MNHTYAQTLNRALRDAMSADPKVIVFGEDVGKLGGVFRITDGLQKDFGANRCYDTPLAESGILGTAIGLAIYGYRPVPEIQFDGFIYPAFEQLVSHIAKYRNRSRGRVRLPITIRLPYAGGIRAVEHHSECPETYFLHTPGLRVVAPGTHEDAYHLLRAAIACDDPVVFLESKSLYWSTKDFELPPVAEPWDKAVVRRPGTELTLLTYGPTLPIALQAAETVAADCDIEVVDLRSLNPLDEETIFVSVRKTGRCVVLHEANGNVGFGAELAARVQQHCFFSLRAPVLRATGFDTPYPPAKLEEFWRPGVDRVLDRVEESLAF